MYIEAWGQPLIDTRKGSLSSRAEDVFLWAPSPHEEPQLPQVPSLLNTICLQFVLI